MPQDLPFEHFHPGVRATLSAFAAKSPRLADLARTHPLAFVALATRYGARDRRAAAIRAVLEGRRLRTVCDLAGIPFCLREVPPQSCPVPVPPAVWSDVASPVLAQFIPDDELTLSNWVPAIFFANGAAGEGFAFWLAVCHEFFVKTPLDHRRLLPLALYAWFAQHPEHELHALLPPRWSSRSRSRRALNATRAWLNRIVCRAYLPGAPDQTEPARPVAFEAFQVVELTDYRTLLAEQQAMDNCLDRYGRRIASGTHAMFSLRTRAGQRLANFEVAVHAPDGPAMCDIGGPSNSEVAPEIADAIERWVSNSAELAQRHGKERERSIDPDAVFADLIAPYVATHASVLSGYGPVTLEGLEDDLTDVARRLGIENWPVRFERTHG